MSTTAVGTFDLDSSQHSVDAPVKYEFVDCSSKSYLSCETCCGFDAIIATEPIVTVEDSSCREVPTFRKAMNGCELRTGDVGALQHEEVPLSCRSPSSAFLRYAA